MSAERDTILFTELKCSSCTVERNLCTCVVCTRWEKCIRLKFVFRCDWVEVLFNEISTCIKLVRTYRSTDLKAVCEFFLKWICCYRVWRSVISRCWWWRTACKFNIINEEINKIRSCVIFSVSCLDIKGYIFCTCRNSEVTWKFSPFSAWCCCICDIVVVCCTVKVVLNTECKSGWAVGTVVVTYIRAERVWTACLDFRWSILNAVPWSCSACYSKSLRTTVLHVTWHKKFNWVTSWCPGCSASFKVVRNACTCACRLVSGNVRCRRSNRSVITACISAVVASAHYEFVLLYVSGTAWLVAFNVKRYFVHKSHLHSGLFPCLEMVWNCDCTLEICHGVYLSRICLVYAPVLLKSFRAMDWRLIYTCWSVDIVFLSVWWNCTLGIVHSRWSPVTPCFNYIVFYSRIFSPAVNTHIGVALWFVINIIVDLNLSVILIFFCASEFFTCTEETVFNSAPWTAETAVWSKVHIYITLTVLIPEFIIISVRCFTSLLLVSCVYSSYIIKKAWWRYRTYTHCCCKETADCSY